MCGIFFYRKKKGEINDEEFERIKNNFFKIKYRGPDNSTFFLINKSIFIGFHRLSINDLSSNGSQPFIFEHNGFKNYLICNGEIYNYKELAKKI